jgi:hypothetical protein
MALQFDDGLRHARLDVIETHIGASPVLKFYSGAPPANCAAANSGTLLATMACPADFMAAAASGQKTLSGPWSVTGSTGGTMGHFRMETSGGTVKIQGTVGLSAASPDMVVDNANIGVGQTFNVTQFTIAEPNG